MKRLQYYGNPNSPPSSNSLLWRKLKKEKREQKKKDGNSSQDKGFVQEWEGHEDIWKNNDCVYDMEAERNESVRRDKEIPTNALNTYSQRTSCIQDWSVLNLFSQL